MEGLSVLREKLDVLLRNYKAMATELSATKAALATKEEETSLLRDRLAKCEEQVLALQIGKAIPDAESRALARKQLDVVIGEIDKILMTIHD
jgi:hypothetical protein